MTFLEATKELMARAISLDDVAHEVGVDILAIRRARLDPSNASYEKPPLNWQEAMARLARKRARSLEALADQLERELLTTPEGPDAGPATADRPSR